MLVNVTNDNLQCVCASEHYTLNIQFLLNNYNKAESKRIFKKKQRYLSLKCLYVLTNATENVSSPNPAYKHL